VHGGVSSAVLELFGYLPHRYSKQNGFDNPSIYCNDLMKLITHIQNKLIEAIPSQLQKQLGIYPLTFEEAYQFTSNISNTNIVNNELLYKYSETAELI